MGFVSHFPPTALDCMESDASTHQILIKINVFDRCKFNFIFTSNPSTLLIRKSQIPKRSYCSFGLDFCLVARLPSDLRAVIQLRDHFQGLQ